MATLSPKPHWLGRLVTILLVILFFYPVVQSAAVLQAMDEGQIRFDFDAFYLVGRMAAEGRAADAYDVVIMGEIQREMLGYDGFMPWTYPPQYDLIAALLALLPRALSFALFTGLTLGAYLLLLSRLAGPALPVVLLALTPPILSGAAIGQNGFLTGSLIAAVVLLSLRNRDAAGWWLGLLVIKPHLGVGLALQALAAGRWRVLAIALLVAAAASLAATWAFSPGIWGAFREAIDAAGRALAAGSYPLFRMISVYALLHTLGAPPALAFWVHIGVAIGACALVVAAVRKGMAPRHSLALACFASVLLSPYFYDYDLTIAGVGLALVASDVLARTGIVERLLLLAVAWVAGGWGLFHVVMTSGLEWQDLFTVTRNTLAYGAAAYLLLLAMIARILWRPAPVPA
ncbi:MAG: glycosyltransferase family 87 protein [Pararhodobacter sp.]